MRKAALLSTLVILALLVTASAVWATPPTKEKVYDFVNIGDPASEAGHDLYGWGPIEPATHGGHWGGDIIPPINTLPCEDGNCRVISSPDSENPTEDWASFTLDFGPGRNPKCLVLRALEGHAKDTFFVYIDSMSTEPIYYWAGDDSASEYWVTHTIPVNLKGKHTIYLVSDQDHWLRWDPVGQVAFTWVKAVMD